MRTGGTSAVAVTGVGMVTPAGIGTEVSWARVCDGRATAGVDPRLVGGDIERACTVGGFDAERLLGGKVSCRTDRSTQFALVAAAEAVTDAGLDPTGWDAPRVAVVCGSAHGGTLSMEDNHHRHLSSREVSALAVPMMLPNMAAGELAVRLHALGPNLSPAMGCVSGTSALGLGRELILMGAADIVLAGASEASVSAFAVACLHRVRALSVQQVARPFDADRDGFVLAEGAAVLVLESLAHARTRGAPVRALLAGHATSADGHHATSPHPEGHGLIRAVTAALADAGLPAGQVEHVNAHATGTPQGDAAEAAALRGLTPQAAVTSVKGCLGHTLGAAGAIEAALTVLTVQHGIVPPTTGLTRQDPGFGLDVVHGAARHMPVGAALSTSSGFGGQNAALVITPA
ncbi:beta-ketoacyl-[acyl-carrier-protein] synthase family protein [Streptomyces niveiscabiei]|uniref:Beta-ketoacyl-[acyl-carrier-protein] synthase family protein n=1 Tax=Streptomyces niveiscabiei TaxID=164115 RepID=A0ABW9HGN2_9ACTN